MRTEKSETLGHVSESQSNCSPGPLKLASVNDISAAQYTDQPNTGCKIVEESKSEKGGKAKKKIMITNLNLNDISNAV